MKRSFSDTKGLVAASLCAVFVLGSLYRLFESERLFYLLLTFRHLVMAGALLVRSPSQYQPALSERIIAYLATAVPLLYVCRNSLSVPELSVGAANILAILGYGFATLATIELGPRFGIAPAVRGERCNTGVYRILRHPIYVGYAIAEAGWLLLDPFNIPLFLFSVSLQIYRAGLEERAWGRL